MNYGKKMQELAEIAWKRYMKNPMERLYIYGRLRKDKVSYLPYISDRGIRIDDILLWNEFIPRDRTLPDLIEWFCKTMRQSPILPVEDN